MNEDINTNSDDYDDDEEGFGALNSMSDLTPSSFTREDLINAQQLRESPYKIKVLRLISEKNGSMEYKQELAQWVQSFFTEEHILADRTKQERRLFRSFDPIQKVLAEAELELAKCELASCKYDQMQSWSKTLPPLLLTTFGAYVSRSVGPDRERLQTNKLVTSQEVTQTMKKDVPQKESVRKRKWF